MKYALIGCGRISSKHIEAAMNNGVEIVAICDMNFHSMEHLAKNFNLSDSVNFYTDYNELIEKEHPDIVAVATDSESHTVIATAAVKAGCNVIIEKPIALSVHDAESIIDLAKEKGVTVCVCHQNRFNKAVQKVREAVEKERFGRLFHASANIRWNRNEDYYLQAPWRGTWEHDGGALMNQCIHNVDLLCWMMGYEVDEVFAYTDNLNHNYIEAEDFGVALIRFKNGSYGIIEGTVNVFPKNLEEALCIFGETGTVKLGGQSVNVIEEWKFQDGLDNLEDVKLQCYEEIRNVYGYGHTLLYADMIDAVKTGRQAYVTADDGKKAMEIVLAMYKSAQLGQPVKLPLKYGSTVDFRREFKKWLK